MAETRNAGERSLAKSDPVALLFDRLRQLLVLPLRLLSHRGNRVFDRAQEVLHRDRLSRQVLAQRVETRLQAHPSDVSPGKPCGQLSQAFNRDARVEGHPLGVCAEDFEPGLLVRDGHVHDLVESPGPKQGRLDHIQTVRGTQDEHPRSEEHTSELQSQSNLVCRLLLEKKKKKKPKLAISRY